MAKRYRMSLRETAKENRAIIVILIIIAIVLILVAYNYLAPA
jgi:hypothetical protein